jgi:N-acetylmuramoyl-L-alanine amidase
VGKVNSRIIITFVILILFFSPYLYTQAENYIEISQYLEKENAHLFWNPVTEIGSIVKKGNTATFKPYTQWILLDYHTIIVTEYIVRKNGALMLPEGTAQLLTTFFAEQEAERASSPHVAVILIDPGHGGKDPGASYTHKTKEGTFTLYEKNLTLEVALYLDSLFKKKYPGKQIILTRSTDTYLKLEERVEIANSLQVENYEAVVYISIHFNASFNKNAKGYEVWYLPPGYRRKLIDEEKADQEEKDIIPILNTMLEEEYTLESITLAQDILNGLSGTVGHLTLNRGMKEESWFVVRNARMPSVLLEVGFITNKEEAIFLNDAEYLKKCAMGIYTGICEFITRFEQTKGFTQ